MFALWLPESGPAPAQNMPEEDEVDLWGKLDSASHEGCEENTRRILRAVGRGERADDVARVNLQVGQEDKVREDTPWYWTMAFPWLFPDGCGDISAPSRVHGFQTKGNAVGDLKHWASVLFAWEDNRFAEDPSFPFVLTNIMQRKTSRGGAAAWLKQRMDDADPTLEEVAATGLDKLDGMFKSVFAQSANVKGTRSYWGGVRRTLEAIVRHQIYLGKALPSFFISSSCAEFHHAALVKVVADAASRKPGADAAAEIQRRMRADETFLRSMIKKYSALVCEYFYLKTKQFIHSVLGPVLDIFDYFLRFEFAKNRGAIHSHMLAWRRDRRPHTLFQEADASLHKFEALIADFLADLGFNRDTPEGEQPQPEGSRAGPDDPNVLRGSFDSIAGCKRKQADVDWMIRHHICTSYCLVVPASKRRRADGTVSREMKCRFFDVAKSNMVQVEGKRGYYVTRAHRPNQSRGRLYRNHKKILQYDLPRSHPRLLQQPVQFLWCWRANMDVSPMLSMDDADAPCFNDTHGAMDYVVSYNCKENPEGPASIQAYKDHVQMLSEQDPARPLSSIVQTLLALSVGEREVPLQQALFEGLGRPCWISSFKTIFVSLGASRRIVGHAKNKNSEDATGSRAPILAKNVADRYKQIVQKVLDDPSTEPKVLLADGTTTKLVRDVSLYDYASTGPQSACQVGSYVPVASGVGHLQASFPLKANFCLSMLRLFKPSFVWNGSLLEGKEGGPDQEQIDEFNAFLQEDACPAFLWADCLRAQTKAMQQARRGTKKQGHPNVYDASASSSSDSGSDVVDSDEEEMRQFAKAVSTKMHADEESSELVEDHRFQAHNFSRLQTLTPQQMRDGVHNRLHGDAQMRGDAFWDEKRRWFDEQMALADSVVMLPKPAALWTEEELLSGNADQKLVLSLILQHCRKISLAASAGQTQPWLVRDVPPLRLIVTGSAGTGKSFVLRAATFLIQRLFGLEAARNCAPSGAAANQNGGTTTHALAGLRPGTCAGVSGSVAGRMQARLQGLVCLFVDEMSMMSLSALAEFEDRMRVGAQNGACGDVQQSFGMIPIVVLLGDHGQLGPCEINSSRLCDVERELKASKDKRGMQIYKSFTSAVFLTRMQRQTSDLVPCYSCPPSFHTPGAPCAFFAEMLHRMRFGRSSEADYVWLLHRHIDGIRQRDAEEAAHFDKPDCLHLVPTREAVHNGSVSRFEHFLSSLASQRGPDYAFACAIRAKNTNAARKHASQYDDFAGLPAFVVLCRDCPVMLTSNRCLPWGLFNGAVGSIRDIIYAAGSEPSSDGNTWPVVILVHFAGYTGPALLPNEPCVVPIFPLERSGTLAAPGNKASSGTRVAFPLKTAFCLTCHKAQGCTCGKGHAFSRVMVDLGDSKTESWAANLGFVALSRATEGSRVAVCGELSLNRVQQMTAGSVVQMVRKEDTRLRSMHEMLRQRQQTAESFESTLRWALHSQPAHPGAGAAQPASSNVPLSTTTSAAGTGRLSQATSLQQSADAATPPMLSTVPGVAWSSAQQHEWLCLRLWQAQQAANALPPNVPPPPPPPPPSV